MKKSIKVLTAVLAVATVGAIAAFAGCGEEAMDPVKYTFEAEYAVFTDSEDSTASIAVETDYVDDYGTSGIGNVGYYADEGDTLTFVITSDRNVTGASFTLVAATADMDWMTGSFNDYDASDHTTVLQVNGTAVAMSGTLSSEGSWTFNYHDWGTLTATIDLVKGENTIKLVCDGTGINVDCITITAGAVLEWTETDNT